MTEQPVNARPFETVDELLATVNYFDVSGQKVVQLDTFNSLVRLAKDKEEHFNHLLQAFHEMQDERFQQNKHGALMATATIFRGAYDGVNIEKFNDIFQHMINLLEADWDVIEDTPKEDVPPTTQEASTAQPLEDMLKPE